MQAATGMPGKTYYVALLKAGDLQAHGIKVLPTPEQGEPGHVSIPVLNYADRKTDSVKEMARLIATHLCPHVVGPFTTPNEGRG